VNLHARVALLERSLEPIHDILADNLLKMMWLDPVVERKDLVVESGQV
jgi:hypothetical protein